MRTPRPAYTLFEVILVLVLLSSAAALALPFLDGMSGPFRLTAAADMVRARWALTRSRAINDGRPYRFAIDVGRGVFRIAPDGPDFWSGGGQPDDGNPTPPLVLEEALPKGVRFVEGDDPHAHPADAPLASSGDASWQADVTFLPDGTATEDREIIFSTQGARPVAVKLRALTGAVKVRTLTAAPNGQGVLR